MIPAVIPFPAIDPVLVEIGPFAIRWYALAYIAGLLLGWRYIVALLALVPAPMTRDHVDDFLVWATFGVILGGRLGYVLFYRPEFYLANPIEILYVWQGGMSFHGGLLGVATSVWLYCRRRGLRLLAVGDLVACAAPIGLFFGRIANFINAELYGRPADVPWAMVFPTGGPMPRHPSQLYEAALEGALLFAVLAVLVRRDAVRQRPGILFGTFLVGYGLARSAAEAFREPDAHLGFLAGGMTMGLVVRARRGD
jgi:phosphatidylglycerol:prolipoprotein diacylglycerol transferase